MGLFVNTQKPKPVEAAGRLLPFLRERGVQCVMTADLAQWIRGEEADTLEDVLACDLVVVLGGDGTVLSAARAMHRNGSPMLTVRFGSFGFMAEVEPEDIEPALVSVLDGNYSIEERPMLNATLVSEGEVREDWPGMNDVALVRGASPRLVRVEAFVDQQPLALYSGDGIIVSTATGSTAYNLAAGGPLVHPTLDALIVTPICPHALHFRPMLVPGETLLSFRVDEMGGEAQVSVDGQVTFPLRFGDVLHVRRSEIRARFVTVPGHASFYTKVRTRLRWGERLL